MLTSSPQTNPGIFKTFPASTFQNTDASMVSGRLISQSLARTISITVSPSFSFWAHPATDKIKRLKCFRLFWRKNPALHFRTLWLVSPDLRSEGRLRSMRDGERLIMCLLERRLCRCKHWHVCRNVMSIDGVPLKLQNFPIDSFLNIPSK